MNSIDILLKLLFAHLIADFIFQTKTVVEKKQQNSQLYHIVHSLIHGTLTYIVLWDIGLWYVPLCITISHYCIDFWKSKRPSFITTFIIDQGFHFLVIVILWLFITNQFGVFYHVVSDVLNHPKFWIYLIGFLIITRPTSILLALITSEWRKTLEIESLKNAGQWIGYLERILILIFICINSFEAIGFLLAAKSIFRFGELKDAKEIKTTEYIMIGTLTSFAIAIVVGLIINYVK